MCPGTYITPSLCIEGTDNNLQSLHIYFYNVFTINNVSFIICDYQTGIQEEIGSYFNHRTVTYGGINGQGGFSLEV